MKLGFFTLRRKLLGSFLICMVIPALLVSIIAYEVAADKIEAELMSGAQSSIIAADMITTQTISTKVKDIDFYAGILSTDMTANLEESELLHELQLYLSTHAEVTNIFVGTKDGLMVRGLERNSSEPYDPRERGWYKDAMDKPGETVISSVSLNTENIPVVFISRVLADGDGVLGMSLNLTALQEMTNMKVGDNGYILMLDGSKQIISHPTQPTGEEAETDVSDGLFKDVSGQFDHIDDTGISERMRYMTNELTGWKIAGVLQISEISQAIAPITYATFIVLGVSTVVIALLSYWLIHSMLKPLQRLRQVAEQISNGDLTQQVAISGRDEIGLLSNHFQKMVNNLRSMVVGIQELTSNLSASSQELAAGAEQTTRAIEHVTVAIQDVASGSEKQADKVQHGQEGLQGIAEQMTSMTSLVAQMAEFTEQSIAASDNGSEQIGHSVVHVDGIRSIVEELDAIIAALNERSVHIGTIVTLMADIARQTNLLSLNASIEAARAGEHGKGFAVVASEVRQLAENSAASAGQITEQIAGIQQQVTEALKAMQTVKERVGEGILSIDSSGRSFSRIRRSVMKAAQQLESVSGAVQDVSHGAEEVVLTMTEVTHLAQEAAAHTETVSAAAQQQLASMEEIGSSAADLTRMAEQLQDLANRFRI